MLSLGCLWRLRKNPAAPLREPGQYLIRHQGPDPQSDALRAPHVLGGTGEHRVAGHILAACLQARPPLTKGPFTPWSLVPTVFTEKADMTRSAGLLLCVLRKEGQR